MPSSARRAGEPAGAAQRATSMPLGSTRTWPAGPMMRCSGAAATRETAFMATPCSAQRPTYPATRRAGSSAPSMQCQVMVVGSPMAVVTRAASTANGLTTPMCTCATSYAPCRRRRRSSGGASGLTGSSNGSRSASRWTGTPSTRSTTPARCPCGPGVAVKTLTS